jgi:membrane carboxypeptidase/penicillin-binding protein
MLRRVLGVCALVAGVIALAMALFFLLAVVYHVYVDREGLPDIGPFARFEFPSVGRVTDVNGNPLIELTREHRMISPYDDIPPIIRNAILATEDKHFFSHNGIDYRSIPRVDADSDRNAAGRRQASARRGAARRRGTHVCAASSMISWIRSRTASFTAF